jgi:hypothetical protein
LLLAFGIRKQRKAVKERRKVREQAQKEQSTFAGRFAI